MKAEYRMQPLVGRLEPHRRYLPTLASLLLLGLVNSSVGVAETTRQEVLDRCSSAIVRVETVLTSKMSMGGQAQEEESRIDLVGAVVDPQGLIMLWNSSISSSRLTDVLGDMRPGGDFRMEVVPTAFTVNLAGEELDAFLVATDSALDLAFIRLEETPADALPFIDYSTTVDPTVGDAILQVQRLGRSFDDAPYLTEARIAGALRKPRAAWIVDGELTGFGLPVFDVSGTPVGAMMTIYSSVGDGAGSLGMGPMSGFFGNSSPFEALQSFVLPARRVAGLIGLAQERAVELLAKRKGDPEIGEETESIVGSPTNDR